MTLALLLAFLSIAQDKPSEKCALSGTVVDSTTSAPLNKVQILLEPLGDSEGPMAVANTSAKGNFSMVELDPGRYRIKAVRNGYLDTYYGARRGDSKGIAVILEAGQELKDLQVKLLPYAVVAGTIRDPDGEPVAGAAVAVRRLIYRDGQRAFDDSENIITDDLGQYRAANLTPGKYYVEARPKDLFDSSHPPVDHSPNGSQPIEALFPAIYPGVQDRASAKAVEVAAGERVTSIDITLPRGRIYRVSGHATLPAGVMANIILNPPDSPFGDRIAWADHIKGDFEIRGIPPGSYLLTAWAETPASPSGAERRYSAEMALSVENADVTGLKIALEPHPEVSGHIAIEGEKPIALHNGGVRYGFGSPMYGADLDSGNAFASTAPPGRYVVTVAGDEMKTGLVIKSIRMEQIDLLRTEMALTPGASLHLEIVLAPDGGQIEGAALDKDEKPVAGATVVAVPEPGLRARPDRYYQASADQHGHYELKNVAPGDYKIFAWDDVEPGAWFDPDFLRAIEVHGEVVKLAAKGHETATAHLTGGK